MFRMGRCPFYDECKIPQGRDEYPLHVKIVCERGPQDDGADSCLDFLRLRAEKIRGIMGEGGGREGVLKFLNDLEGTN